MSPESPHVYDSHSSLRVSMSLTLLVNVDLLFCRISFSMGFLTVTLELCIIAKNAEGHFPPFSLWALSKHCQLLRGPLSPRRLSRCPAVRGPGMTLISLEAGEHTLSGRCSDGFTEGGQQALVPPWLQGLIWLCSVTIQTQRSLSLWPCDACIVLPWSLWCCGSSICPLLIRPDTWTPTETSVMAPALSPVSLRSSAGWSPQGQKDLDPKDNQLFS